jgi:hypothetical protein
VSELEKPISSTQYENAMRVIVHDWDSIVSPVVHEWNTAKSENIRCETAGVEANRRQSLDVNMQVLV